LNTLLVLRWISYVLLIGSTIPLGLAIHQFIKSRRARYYAMRRTAFDQAMRWLLVFGGALVLGIILLVTSSIFGRGEATPTPTVTPAITAPPTVTLATSTETAIPTATALPTQLPTATPIPQPTAAATAAPPISPLPTVDQPVDGATPLASPLPAGPDARITFTALAMEKDDSGLPVNPDTQFPPGDHAVYVFFTYEGMQNGVERTFAWYKDGEYFERCSQTALWDWGDRGRTSYYCRPSTGWESGSYEVHVLVEEELQFVAEFVIVSE
jgi:hypothetical protein